MRSPRLGCAVLVALWIAAQTAAAGPPEELVQVVFHPRDPEVMALRYIIPGGGSGLIFTQDSGSHWQMLCDQAVAPDTRSITALAITGDGTTLAAREWLSSIRYSLLEDDRRACSWTPVAALDNRYIISLAVHPRDPDVTFLVTADANLQNSLYQRDAQGDWRTLGDPQEGQIRELLAVPVANGVRLYTSTMHSYMDPDSDAGSWIVERAIRVSDDLGESWEQYPVEGVGNEAFALLAVDPSNPDRIAAAIDRGENENDTLLVSVDRGASFTEYLSVSNVGGVAFAPDGRVWIGEAGAAARMDLSRGLWFASSLAVPAQKLADFPVVCLAYQAASDKLYACQYIEFGSVDPVSGAFSASLQFTKAAEFVSCDGQDMAAACKEEFCLNYCGPGHFAQAPVCNAYPNERACGPCLVDAGSDACKGLPPLPDAGVADAGQGDDGPADGCSCGVIGRKSDPGALGIPALVCLALAVRRRRRS